MDSVDIVKCDIYNLHEGDVAVILAALRYKRAQCLSVADETDTDLHAYADRLLAVAARVSLGSSE